MSFPTSADMSHIGCRLFLALLAVFALFLAGCVDAPDPRPAAKPSPALLSEKTLSDAVVSKAVRTWREKNGRSDVVAGETIAEYEVVGAPKQQGGLKTALGRAPSAYEIAIETSQGVLVGDVLARRLSGKWVYSAHPYPDYLAEYFRARDSIRSKAGTDAPVVLAFSWYWAAVTIDKRGRQAVSFYKSPPLMGQTEWGVRAAAAIRPRLGKVYVDDQAFREWSALESATVPVSHR